MSTQQDFHHTHVQYAHTISEAGRLLPSPGRWSAIDLDFNLLPRSATGFDSLPSSFSKSIDFNLKITNKQHFKRFLYIAAFLILIIPALVLLLHFFPHKKHHKNSPKNLTLALNQALLFFDAQKSGPYRANDLIKFRGNSGMKDGSSSDKHPDLVGGFYDSGKNIKLSSTTAYSVALLSWTVIEYHQKYADLGELDHVKDIIKWGSDYLLKLYVPPNITSRSSAILYSQVGGNNTNSENDITCWQRPEDMTYTRQVSVCDLAASDLAGEIVAGMSAASIVFREDKTYSQKLVQAAESLFTMTISTAKKATYTTINRCGGNARPFYNSTSYKDELVWGGTWLFFATGNETYLEYATENLNADEEEEVVSEKGVFYWNNKLTANMILLTRIRFFRDLGYPFENAFVSSTNRTDLLMCSYTSNQKFSKTEGGLILLNPDNGAPLQYAVTASFLSKLYSDYLELLHRFHGSCNSAVFSLQNLRDFSISQVNYILGDNPGKMSYVVGYGERYPLQVHHRAASIRWDNRRYFCAEGEQWLESKEANPNTLVGAMVAGPDKSERFWDERKQPWFTEPSISSNAGLVAALIALHDPPSHSSGSNGVNLGLDKLGLFDKVH
nr:endoglucanase 9-like [Ipomoea batatas]